MEPLKIAENTYWIGKVDDRKVPFHRLILEKGTTYNSYLLMTEKPTIIDTVDIAFGREYVENLDRIIDPASIEYIVINHVEPDHAGALPALANKAKGAKIVTTELGAELLKDMFKLYNREFIVIKEGDTLDIGGKTLKFFETPYLHTEETMMTYSVEDNILFSCDVFSTHIAAEEIFNDLAKKDYVEDFKTYYKLIITPHRAFVRNMLSRIEDLPIKVIAPSHGYVLRENPEKFIKIYDEMSDMKGRGAEKNVVIAFSTMTGNTMKVAKALVNGLKDAGVSSQVFNLKDADLDMVREEILKSDGFLAGSSTKYGDMVGTVEELLKSLKGRDVKGKLAAAFGSYGWSGEAIIHIEDYLGDAGFTVVNRNYLIKKTGMDMNLLPLRVRFAREEDLKVSEEAGKVFAEQVTG
jgi:Uncharacterized flavoproteins